MNKRKLVATLETAAEALSPRAIFSSRASGTRAWPSQGLTRTAGVRAIAPADSRISPTHCRRRRVQRPSHAVIQASGVPVAVPGPRQQICANVISHEGSCGFERGLAR